MNRYAFQTLRPEIVPEQGWVLNRRGIRFNLVGPSSLHMPEIIYTEKQEGDNWLCFHNLNHTFISIPIQDIWDYYEPI